VGFRTWRLRWLLPMVLLAAAPLTGTTPAVASTSTQSAAVSLQLSGTSLVADGSDHVTLQVGASAAGAPLAGADVKLTTTWSTPTQPGRLRFDPATVHLGASGSGTTTITSNRAGSAVISASIADRQYRGTASVTLESVRRSIVVFLDGGGSSVTCQGPGDCSDPYNPFAPISGALTTDGYTPSDQATFSYTGGSVDATTGNWVPDASTCAQSAESYKAALRVLVSMVRSIAQAHPNSDISLIGLSQGGLLAFQSLELLAALPDGARVTNVVTFDAPLGGIPLAEIQHLDTVASLTCWSENGQSPAASQVVGIWNSIPPGQGPGQGDDATVLCHLVKLGGCPDSTNAEVVAQSHATVETWGNTEDGIFNPAACGFPGYVDATDSEIVTTAGGGLHAEGFGSAPSSCTIGSHTAAVANHAGDVVALLGAQP
jgi:hypothetical protein